MAITVVLLAGIIWQPKFDPFDILHDMNLLQIINAVVVTLGLPTLIAACILIGRKFQIIDTLQKAIDDDIKPDLKDVRERFFTLEGRAGALFQASSPVELLQKGKDALQQSGMKEYIDQHTRELLSQCDPKRSATAYEVQAHIFDMFDKWDFGVEVGTKLEQYAYVNGIPMSTLRRIGAIYFRGICLNDFKMNPDDIDRQENEFALKKEV